MTDLGVPAAPPRPSGRRANGRDPSPTASDRLQALHGVLGHVVRGKDRALELVVVAVAAGGHVLLEDVPGVGKTVLARTLSAAIDGTVRRVQGAPDLLPVDVTGGEVLDAASHELRFVPGPLFANVVLVDELNRTTPRTQAALLEAMEEGQVTAGGTTHPLPDPHVVVATQNPVEHAGTFPLPASQLDRFTVRLHLGHPTPEVEAEILAAQLRRHPLLDVDPVLTPGTLAAIREHVRATTVSAPLLGYVSRLVAATRTHRDLALGASTRASVQLVRAAQAHAVLRGRGHVLPDDEKRLARHVLAHRLVVRPGVTTDGVDVVTELLERVPVDDGRSGR